MIKVYKCEKCQTKYPMKNKASLCVQCNSDAKHSVLIYMGNDYEMVGRFLRNVDQNGVVKSDTMNPKKEMNNHKFYDEMVK